MMNVSCKEVSSIQVSIRYTDGSTEVRGFRSTSPTLFQAPLSPPDSDHGIPMEDDQNTDDEPSKTRKPEGIIFEPQEIETFPQASGYLNTDNIFVVTKNTDREGLAFPVQDEPLCLSTRQQVNTAIHPDNDAKLVTDAVIGKIRDFAYDLRRLE